MRKFLTSLCLFFIAFSFSQTKKYQSLLWEISGNGLSKKSYIYGSMHVSERVSYHLSDAFFTHLLQADFVANESEPSTWSDLNDLFGNQGFDFGSSKLYRSFYQKPMDKRALYRHFRNENFSMDNLLFRTNEFRKDYQEETYLDMFIYQTGRKYRKKTVGLEDAKESMALILNIDYEDQRPNEENMQKLAKLLKGKLPGEAMVDFYREKDLDMLDSLSILSSPASYLENMLFKRNEIMTKSMDSIMKKGSLFAAVGAAHLPGNRGMIEMLRKKGYTVTPVFDDYTEKGKNAKKTIEELYIAPELKEFTSEDQMIQLPAFSMVLPQGNDYNSPDLTNGGYINIKRSPLWKALQKNKAISYEKTLDSLFFENIPGDILEKKLTQENGNWMYEIQNKTKTGNFQRHRFYVTPLEIISVSLVGTNTYATKLENQIFPKIQLAKPTNEWKNFTPYHQKFRIKTPNYLVVYGNRAPSAHPETITLLAHLPQDQSFYFLLEKKSEDVYQLENTSFELHRIQEEFLLQYDVKNNKEIVEENSKMLWTKSEIYGQTIYLKTVVNGANYYLLGCVGCNESNSNDFLGSFELMESSASDNQNSLWKNEAAQYTVEIPKKQNEIYFLKESKKSQGNNRSKKTNHFTSNQTNAIFTGTNGEKVHIWSYEYHPYEYEKSKDSILEKFRKNFISSEISKEIEVDGMTPEMIPDFLQAADFANNSAQRGYYGSKKAGPIMSNWDKVLNLDHKDTFGKKYQLVQEKRTEISNPDGLIYEAQLQHPDSENAIQIKWVITDGMHYTLKSLVPKNQSEKAGFAQQVFQSFQPLAYNKKQSLFEPKLGQFLEDIQSEHDSIRYSALQSARYLNIDKNEWQLVQEWLNNWEEEEDALDAMEIILEKIASIYDIQALTFSSKIYLREDLPPSIQFAILKGLAKQKNKEAYLLIRQLMLQDLPISDDASMIDNLFEIFEENIEYSALLMPAIFQFYSIPEYHEPILNFTKKLLENEKLTSKQLKSYQKMLLTNAKLEYKRVRSWKLGQQRSDYYDASDAPEVCSYLFGFMHLLEPFKKDKEKAVLWEKIRNLSIREVTIEMYALESKKGNISKNWEKELLENPETQFAITYLMAKNKKMDISEIPCTDMDMAISAIYLFDLLEAEKVQMQFLEEKTQMVGNQKIKFFFFKGIKDNSDDIYYENFPILYSIGFVENSKGELQYQSFYSGLQKQLVDEDDLPWLMQEIMDKSIHENKKRTSFGKIQNNFGMMDGFYMD